MPRRSSVTTAILLRTLSCAGIVGNAFITPPLHVRSLDVVSSLENTRSTGVGVRRRQAGVHRAKNSELDQSAETRPEARKGEVAVGTGERTIGGTEHANPPRVLVSRQSVAANGKHHSQPYVKAELARVEAEYEEKRKAKILEQTKQAAARGDAAVTPLADLDFIPYIDGEGMVTKLDTAGVKASVYAVYDESKTMQYIGVSRGIHQSLRLHLGRHPKDTYHFKVQHFARPSRSLLEIVKNSWIEENGCTPSGNDGGECQASWENPINVMPLFTEEDRAFVAAKKEKGKEEMGIKTLARRFEGEIVKVLEERAIKESMYFDPKLKGKGLLDLLQQKPDTSVPKN